MMHNTTPPKTPPQAEQSAAQEIKTALSGFVSDVAGFHADTQSKLQKQEKRLNELDRTAYAHRRPALSTAAEIALPHQKAFNAYLRTGDEEALRGLDMFESKALSSGVSADGGYLVDPQTADTIQSVLRATSSLRSVANVVNVEAASYDVLIDHTDLGSGWVSESGSVGESTTPSIERISIPLYELSAMPKASQRLLDDSAFDVETWLAQRIADKFSRSEAAAFLNGDGTDKPKGILQHSFVANTSWGWGKIGYVPTGKSAGLNDGDALVDLVYALGAEYRAGASFVMNSKTAGILRKLKDADGRFLWTDGLAAGTPAMLLGYRVVIAEDMPDVAANSMSVLFGDFSKGYTIAERPDMRILRDPFSAKPHVLFYATKRVGGDVSDFAALKALKFSAS